MPGVTSFSVQGGDQANAAGQQEWMATIAVTMEDGETVSLSFTSAQQTQLVSDLENTNPPSPASIPPLSIPGNWGSAPNFADFGD